MQQCQWQWKWAGATGANASPPSEQVQSDAPRVASEGSTKMHPKNVIFKSQSMEPSCKSTCQERNCPSPYFSFLPSLPPPPKTPSHGGGRCLSSAFELGEVGKCQAGKKHIWHATQMPPTTLLPAHHISWHPCWNKGRNIKIRFENFYYHTRVVMDTFNCWIETVFGTSSNFYYLKERNREETSNVTIFNCRVGD